MAVHPFVGLRLRITRRLRGSINAPGLTHFEVEGPDGRPLRVPITWTDRGVGPALSSPAPTQRVTARELLALVRVVDGIREAAPCATLGDDASTPPTAPACPT